MSNDGQVTSTSQPLSIAKIATALAKAQGAFPVIPKDSEVIVYSKDKPKSELYRYKYADLTTIISCTRPALAENEISFTQGVVQGGFITTLMHSSGEILKTGFVPCEIPKGSDMKAVAGMITYVKRISLTAALGVSADEDIDAAALEAQAGKATDKAPAKGQKPKEEPPKMKPADFVMPLGKTEVKGKKLSELSREILDSILKWTDEQLKLKPKPKNIKDVVEINSQLKAYLKTLPTPPPPNDQPAEPQTSPEDEVQSFPEEEAQQVPSQDEDDPADFLIIVDHDFAGVKLRDLSESDVKELYKWAEAELKKVPPVKGLARLIELNRNIKAFLQSMGAWPINLAPGGGKK